MKINGANDARGLRPSGPARRRGAADGPAFAAHLNAPGAAAAAESASGVGNVAALLAVQAAGDALEGRRQAYDRADSLIRQMDALRLALLDGRIDDLALDRIAKDLQKRIQIINDPQLAEIVAEIELRAQVELAKRNLI